MKKSLFLLSIFALALMTSCKTTPTPEQLSCNPNPLTVVGNAITAEITGTFPEKKFIRKGVLEVTPVLKFNGKEVLGETVTYVGEKAKVNGKVVSYANGGTYKQTFRCEYQEEMAVCELYLRFRATKGNKEYEQPDVKVADGVISKTAAKSVDFHSFWLSCHKIFKRVSLPKALKKLETVSSNSPSKCSIIFSPFYY